jgi:hypothetical protein
MTSVIRGKKKKLDGPPQSIDHYHYPTQKKSKEA